MQTIPDSNVVLDVFLKSHWMNWSAELLARCQSDGGIVINAIVYAEVSARFMDAQELDAEIDRLGISYEEIPRAAAFIAGKAHQTYRKAGGLRERTLPDFLIGAHAAASGYRLLTRDASRFRSYFPDLDIIAPDTHP